MNNDNKRLINDSIKLTIAKAITMLLSMLVAMLLSRFRTLEEYGTYSQLLLVINVVSSILMLGLPNSINFFLARAESDEERQKFLSIYFTLSTLFSLLCGASLLIFIQPLESYFNNSNLSIYWYFLLFHPWATITITALENISIIYNKTNYLIAYSIVRAFIQVLLVYICYVIKTSFQTYILAFIIIESIFALLVYLLTFVFSKKLYLCFNFSIIKKVFIFCIPLGIASAVGTLTLELDKLMIGFLFSTEQLAIYTNAARELPVSFISAAITAVLMPKLVVLLKDNKNNEAAILWGKTVVVSFSLIMLISVGCFVFASDVISLLYSEKYIEGVNIFRVYCLVLPLRCTYWGIILNSIGKTRFIFMSSVITLITNALLNYLLYLVFGILGPPIATFVSIIIASVVQIFVTAKVLKVSFKKIMPWDNIVYILLINIFLACVFYYLKKWIPLDKYIMSEWESVVLGIVWSLLYAVIMFKFLKKQLGEIKGDTFEEEYV